MGGAHKDITTKGSRFGEVPFPVELHHDFGARIVSLVAGGWYI